MRKVRIVAIVLLCEAEYKKMSLSLITTNPVVITPTTVGSRGTSTPPTVATTSSMTDILPSIPPGPQG